MGPIRWEDFTDFVDFFNGKFAGINFHVFVNRDLFRNVCKDCSHAYKQENTKTLHYALFYTKHIATFRRSRAKPHLEMLQPDLKIA